ncbi:flagella assembly protein FlgT [Psychromonas marina]|uniref:Flagella assembly protein FlgT n=1 Tax=Psychromonas marina TaxID=88364 RepID=A0ABQ6DW17_9GAMM|nr:flagellar assembly protein T N-terminal domain-containing protein [Psychromonas marina]GLS89301.1 flagella assembly protein FlgT [Psychromonas marina]
MNSYALFFLLIFSSITQAQWFESSATAVVNDGNWEGAREDALKKAVKNALLFSGGAISSLQQVKNGVLVDNKLVLNSEGEIKALAIIKEEKGNQRLDITIKVDIQQSAASCEGSHFPKSIALTRFKLNTPEQAVDGRIFDIHQLISKTLFNQLQLSPQILNVRQFIDSPVKLGTQYQNNNQTDTLHALATTSDSQFIVYGEINDISVQFKSKNSLSYWISDPTRYFHLTVYLYDALQGHLVSSKQYRTQADWQYNQHEQANLQSKAFWKKDYGQAILSLLDEVNTDLTAQLQCLQPTAKVISVKSNSVQINLGKHNGLKHDSLLSLFHSSSQKDQFGIERSSINQYPSTMKVVEIGNNSALIQPVDNHPLDNIQINDVARVK